MIKRALAFVLMLVSLVLFVNVSRQPVATKAIHDPLGAIDRDILGRLNSLCTMLWDRHSLTVAIEVDTVIADEMITSRAEKFVQRTQESTDGEWVALYLLTNGECFYSGSQTFLQHAEDVGVSNLDLIVMKEHELSGIDNAVESFLSNITYVVNSQSGHFPEPDSLPSKGVYATLLIQVGLALLFAIGLALLLFDLLISRATKESKKIPTPLFGGDYIQYESTLFGVGLKPRKRSSL